MTGYERRLFLLEVTAANLSVADSNDEVGLLGRNRLDVVGRVVGGVAREDDASRDDGLGLGLLKASRVHLLDSVVVVGVHDGRDVKVGQAIPAVEGNS